MGSTGDEQHFIDVDSIKPSGPRRFQLWAKIELAKPTYGMGTRSMKLLLEHDCLLRKQRSLQAFYFTGLDLTGDVDTRGASQWVDVEVGTMGFYLNSIVCRLR